MKKIIAFVIAALPGMAFAQQLTDINSVANKATSIGSLVISIAISLAVVWIIVSIVRYLIAGGEEQRKKGAAAVLWGVVGLALILSIWGLVYLFTNTFKTQNQTPTSDINRTTTLPTPNVVQ